MGRSVWDLLVAAAVLSAAGMRSVEAGVQRNHFHRRKLLYFYVCRSGWTDTAVVVGKAGSGGSIEAWFTVEGMSDWNINVDIFLKVDTKQELHTVD